MADAFIVEFPPVAWDYVRDKGICSWHRRIVGRVGAGRVVRFLVAIRFRENGAY